MNDATELLAYELRRTHHESQPSASAVDRARTDLSSHRRRARRHRLASRFRAVADRLDS